MLPDCFRLVWQPELLASFFYFSPDFHFTGSGGFSHLARESLTGFIAVFIGWPIYLFLPASDCFSLFGLD